MRTYYSAVKDFHSRLEYIHEYSEFASADDFDEDFEDEFEEEFDTELEYKCDIPIVIHDSYFPSGMPEDIFSRRFIQGNCLLSNITYDAKGEPLDDQGRHLCVDPEGEYVVRDAEGFRVDMQGARLATESEIQEEMRSREVSND